MPPPPPTGLRASLLAWLASEHTHTRPHSEDDLLYPAQAVDGLVHQKGSSKLKAALAAQPILERRDSGEHIRCRVGEAKLTAGEFNGLDFDAIVHTVPPFWPRGDSAARETWAAELHSCYKESFEAAIEFAAGCDRSGDLAIAVPLLGSGARGAPITPAARVLAEAAAQAFGEARGSAADFASLRVVMNPASFESEVAEVAAVMDDVMQVASP